MRHSPILATVAGLAIALSTFADDLATLELHLQEGADYPLKVATTQTMTRTLFGFEQATQSAFTIEYAFHVQAIDPDTGTATLEATYNRIAVSIDDALVAFAYDSAAPPETVPDGAQAYAALAGATFTMELRPDGTVPRVDGMDDTITEILASVDLPDAAKAQLESQLRRQFTDEAVARVVGQMLAIYPGKPVAIGATWPRQIDGSGMVPIVIDSTWTLKELTADTARLAVESTIHPAADPAIASAAGMNLSADFGGNEAGTVELDRNTGWMRRAERQQKLSGSIAMSSDATGGAKISVPVVMTTTISIEGGK